MIDWLHEKAGGSSAYELRRGPRAAHHKSVYRWGIGSRMAESLLPTITPYLIVKKRQAGVADRFFVVRRQFREEVRASVGRVKDKPPRDESRFAALHREMVALNRRGL